MAQRFASFIASVETLLRRGGEAPETVAAIEPLMRELVLDPDWLEEKYRRPIPHKPYAQYLLHRPADHLFSVVSFVWNPQQGSPVHDHCTWGVIGQYVGVEEESRYRKGPGGTVEMAGAAAVKPGDVSHVYPPDRDIHRIMNRSGTPTISVHIYGGDIGSQPRHIYDPETGITSPFISGYDAV